MEDKRSFTIKKDSVKEEPLDVGYIWDHLEDFAKYAFNKSHAVAYTLVSYWTAKVWSHHKDEYLEWVLNNTKKEKQKFALQKCKELGYTLHFPSYKEIKKSDKFTIKDGKITPPIGYDLSYDTLSEFLFSSEPQLVKLELISMGVLDTVCPDRMALYEIFKNIQKDFHCIPNFPPTNNLLEIFEYGVMLGTWELKSVTPSEIEVQINKPRSSVIVKLCRSKNDLTQEKIAYNIKKDLKHFGLIRHGIISNFPDLKIERAMKKCNLFKNKLLSQYNVSSPDQLNRNDRYNVRKLILAEVKKSLYDPIFQRSIEKLRSEEFTGLMKEYKDSGYGYSKIVITFNNIDNPFFLREKAVGGLELILAARKFKKGQLIKFNLDIDYYLNNELDPVVYLKIKNLI